MVSRTGQLSTTQDLLREAKDRQLQLDLSQKGIEIGNLKVAADAAEAEIATAKTEMAKQQTRAATAERNLLELQQKIQWRTITAKQKQQFLDLTKDIPKGSLAITSMDGDPESAAFAKQLNDLFTAAGWSPTLGSVTMVGGTPMGLLLRVPSLVPVKQDSPLFHAVILEKALEKIGFQTGTLENKDLPKDKGDLLVGHKP